MQISAGGSNFEVVECVSPVPGRRAVVFKEAGGQAWPDLFLWDPVSQTVHFDGDQLRSFVTHAMRARTVGISALLAITDTVTGLGRGAHRMASGSYSGLFGFGETGSVIASLGAAMNLTVKVLAFIVALPFRLVGGVTRLLHARSLSAEENRLIDEMPAVFAALAAGRGE